MSSARAGTPGATRVCPHCKAIVLETATVCPGCRHHLRFTPNDALVAAEGYSAFNIEGTIAHKQASEHCEYCIVLDIRNERGEQVIRQVVGVGALHPGELRRLSLAVEMLPVRAGVPKPDSAPVRDERRSAATASPARAPAAAATAPLRPPGPAIAVSAAAPSRAPAAAQAQSSAPPKPAGIASAPGGRLATNPTATRSAPAAAASTATPSAAPAARSGETRVTDASAGTEPKPLSPSPSGQQLRSFRKP